MKNKKLWARIGAILACVLLVGALAIPCFADDHPVHWPPSSDFKQSFYNVFLDDDMKNSALDSLMSFMGDGFYNTSVLLSGQLTADFHPTNFDSYSSSSDFVSSTIVRYSFYYNNAIVAADVGLLEISFYRNIAAVILQDIDYNDLFTFEYSLSKGDDGEVARLSNITNNMTGEIYDINSTMYLAVAIQSAADVSMIANIPQLLYGVDSTWVSPKQYYYGFSDGFDVGYDVGRRVAIDELGSGVFGKNLLEGVFTAPLRALDSFTLIEWETQSGSVYTISLMTILSAIIGLSLFIWFLKLFAGG